MKSKKKKKKILKSQVGDGAIKTGYRCYVCGKPIKATQRYYAIGKDEKGVELYRHIKCKPTRSIL